MSEKKDEGGNKFPSDELTQEVVAVGPGDESSTTIEFPRLHKKPVLTFQDHLTLTNALLKGPEKYFSSFLKQFSKEAMVKRLAIGLNMSNGTPESFCIVGTYGAPPETVVGDIYKWDIPEKTPYMIIGDRGDEWEVLVPVRNQQKVAVGIVLFGGLNIPTSKFGENEEAYGRELSGYLSHIFHNKEVIDRLSLVDQDTGAYNKWGLYHYLKGREPQRLNDPDSPFTIIFLDVDGCGQYNDLLGYLGTDAMMVDFYVALLRQFTREDKICRYGGDEWVVLIEKVGRQTMARRIRDDIAPFFNWDWKFTYQGKVVQNLQFTAVVGSPKPGEVLKAAFRRISNHCIVLKKHLGCRNIVVTDQELEVLAALSEDEKSQLRQKKK